MNLESKDILILRQSAEHGAAVGVAQVRAISPDGRRITREGSVGLLQQGGGREARTLLTPDEARELGCQLLIAAAVAANSLPPMIAVQPPTDAPPELPKVQQ
jgi:hypothetical protein